MTEPNKNPSPDRASADSKQTVAPLTDLVKDLDARDDADRIKGGAGVKKTMSTQV